MGEGSSSSRWLLPVVCVGQFMVVLDLSIVNVALPAMRHDLHFSTSGLQWVVNAYALAFGGFLLLGGRLADLFGRKRIFLVGLALFCGASLVCALAQDQGMLVAFRALQGLGAAVLSPATLTLITTSYAEPVGRSRALGIWSAMAAAGGASGALLGGVLTDLLSWRWIFLINVPIGLATIAAARVVLNESKSPTRPRLDLLGAFSVTGGLVALVYAVAETTTHTWTSAFTVGWLFLAAALLAAFVVVETRPSRAPLVPFALFRSRALAGANLAMLMVGGAMFSMWLFLSLYLQNVLRFSPLQAGLGFLPQTLAIVVGAQISSRLVARIGARPPLLVGALCSAGGLAWLAHIAAGQSYWDVAFGGATLATFGMGLAMTPLAFAATQGVAPQQAGLASGVLNTSRQVGGSVGLAALATAAADRTAALARSHDALAVAATGGFSRAFAIGAGIALAGAALSTIIPARPRSPSRSGEAPAAGRAPASAPSTEVAAVPSRMQGAAPVTGAAAEPTGRLALESD